MIGQSRKFDRSSIANTVLYLREPRLSLLVPGLVLSNEDIACRSFWPNWALRKFRSFSRSLVVDGEWTSCKRKLAITVYIDPVAVRKWQVLSRLFWRDFSPCRHERTENFNNFSLTQSSDSHSLKPIQRDEITEKNLLAMKILFPIARFGGTIVVSALKGLPQRWQVDG